ncbi:MAG: alanine racemase, partial [Acidimicrobiales bacterium]
KVDTGMHRVGAEPDDAEALAAAIVAAPGLVLQGLWTHLAVADDPAQDDFTALQLARFDALRARLAAAGVRPPLVHAANSAGAMAHPASRYDMVRCGIALYGYTPSRSLRAAAGGLRPVLSLRARVAYVRRFAVADRVSYGRRYEVAAGSVVATVPLGYADGVARRLAEVGGEVLIGGRRRPMAGTVTMDQLLVDCGPEAAVAVGDEVVLIGGQGDQQITATEWADRLDTISYEVLCGISARVPRVWSTSTEARSEVGRFSPPPPTSSGLAGDPAGLGRAGPTLLA